MKTEPQSLNNNKNPEIIGPMAAIAAPIPDHKAIALVLSLPDQMAAISARVVGNAIPAARPPKIRAAMRISIDGAKPASRDDGMARKVPIKSIILRPWRSSYSTEP